MSLSAEILGVGAAVPFAVALAVVWLANRFLPHWVTEWYAGALALLAAYWTGYALLP